MSSNSKEFPYLRRMTKLMGSVNDGRNLPLSYLKVGRRIASRYEVLEVLGRGGSGVVVKAKDLQRSGSIVALKILYPRFAQSSNTLGRFRREVLLTRALLHANIVRVFDLGVTQDTETGETLEYLTMEWVAGESLAAKLKRCAPHGLLLEEIPKILRGIALGLAYAHTNEIVHGDIKPSNILINASGDVKIADFGIARVIDSAERLSQTDEAITNARYISPEYATAQRIDGRTDIYSLGILAFEIASGTLPFKQLNWKALLSTQFNNSVPNLSSLTPAVDVPRWFQELVETACIKDRSLRYQTGHELAAAAARHAAAESSDLVPGSFYNRFGWSALVTAHLSGAHTGRFAAPSAAMLLFALIAAGGYAVVAQLWPSWMP